MRVLIIGETFLVRNDFKRILSSFAIENIIEANSCKEAVSRLITSTEEKQYINMIIADFKKPRLDTISILKVIREGDLYKQTPFIIISEVSDRATVQEALMAGASEFLTRPLNHENVVERINKYFL